MSLGITTLNAPPISGAMPRRSARFRRPTPRLAPAVAGRPVLELHRDRHSSTPQVRPDRRPARALGSRGLCGCVAALLSTRVKPARSQPQPKARLPLYTSVGMRVVHGHFCTWGGLHGFDLPPLPPRNLGWNVPPTYQGTQRNQNFFGAQGETSVLDQVKSASSCQ